MTTTPGLPTLPSLPAAKAGTPLARVNATIELAIMEPPLYEGVSHLDRLTHHLVLLAENREAGPARDVAWAAATWLADLTETETGQVLASQALTTARMLMPTWNHPINPATEAPIAIHAAWDLTTDVACMIASGHTYLETDDRLLEKVVRQALAAATWLNPEETA